MRVALLDRTIRSRGAFSSTSHLPAPTGGWNTRDSLAEMDPLDAPLLNNWFPREGQCQLRGGSSEWATGMSGTVKTLMQYQAAVAAGVGEFFAVTDAGIYDISITGAVGAVVQALTNGYFNSINITNSAGTAFLWGCNGTDAPVHYNGSAWAAPSITGVTAANLIYPTLFKHRIFVVEKDTMNVWYLPVDSVAGAAGKLPYGSFFRRGGYVMSISNWTLDSGLGPDDLFATVSSEGELAIFSGTDPSSADTWAIVGVWNVGRPIGRRCFKMLGADVVLLTENGAFPLSRLLKSGNINFATALSNKIQPSFTDAVREVGLSTPGWEAVNYPKNDALIVNIPMATGVSSRQFVMNTVTGAWCSFTGWEAYCFEVFDEDLYFGGAGGKVFLAWDGESDVGTDIVATSHQAYNYFGTRTQLKLVNLFRVLMSYNAAVEFSWAVSPDFTTVPLNSLIPRGVTLTGELWDQGFWDTFYWAGTSERFKNWKAASHYPGYALALWLQISTKDASVAWSGTDFILADGGAM